MQANNAEDVSLQFILIKERKYNKKKMYNNNIKINNILTRPLPNFKRKHEPIRFQYVSLKD